MVARTRPAKTISPKPASVRAQGRSGPVARTINAVSAPSDSMNPAETTAVILVAPQSPASGSIRHRARVPDRRPKPTAWAVATAVIEAIRAGFSGVPVSRKRCTTTSIRAMARKLNATPVRPSAH